MIWKKKKLGNFKLQFPSTWNECSIEGQLITHNFNIKANSDNYVEIVFKSSHVNDPMVIPIAFSTTGTWAYITSMVTGLTKTKCNLSFHNLESNDVSISVGYIAIS